MSADFVFGINAVEILVFIRRAGLMARAIADTALGFCILKKEHGVSQAPKFMEEIGILCAA